MSKVADKRVLNPDALTDLYEALSQLRDWAQATAPHATCGKPLGCITCGFVEKADAALSKALGEAQ